MKKSLSPTAVSCLCVIACAACLLSSCQSTSRATSSTLSAEQIQQREFEYAVRMLVETENGS